MPCAGVRSQPLSSTYPRTPSSTGRARLRPSARLAAFWQHSVCAQPGRLGGATSSWARTAPVSRRRARTPSICGRQDSRSYGVLVSWVLWARADRVNVADVIQHAVTARRKVDEVAVLSGNRTWPRVGDSGTPTTGTTRNNLTPSSAAQHQLTTRGQSSVGSAQGSRRWPTRRTPAEPARRRQTVHESGRPVPRAGR